MENTDVQRIIHMDTPLANLLLLILNVSTLKYSLQKIIIAPSGHTVLLLILNIDLFPFLWGTGNLMVITQIA